jgi:DNA polymerase III subunit delta
MKYKEINDQLHKKQYAPIYLLHGEEPYFIDTITGIIENQILTDSEKSFNQTILYGKEVDAMAVVDISRRYPMMASHQVVIIKEAQSMDGLANLLSYVEKPLNSTILVIAYKHKKLDMRTAFAKALAKQAVVFESKPVYDNAMPAFIQEYIKDLKLKIEADGVALLVEYLGRDLGKVANELDKLAINLQKGATISTKNIEEFIGVNRDYTVFELHKALGFRNTPLANKITLNLIANIKSNPLQLIIPSIFGYFSKLYILSFTPNANDNEAMKALKLSNPYFVGEYRTALTKYPKQKLEQVIQILKEYDLKSKGVDYTGGNDGELMKELMFKILNT